MKVAVAEHSNFTATDGGGNTSRKIQCENGGNHNKTYDGSYCMPKFDGYVCWPQTNIDKPSVQACDFVLNGVEYDPTTFASRYCALNGTWDDKANYTGCFKKFVAHNCTLYDPDLGCMDYVPSVVYSVNYTISLVALVAAVIIFMNFKDLRCLRNTIHINLFLSYILSILLWLLTVFFEMFGGLGSVACVFVTTGYHYFLLTNFFWMMVEGLYLYMLVVQTFSGDNIRFNLYAVIGWGFPSVFVVLWAICRASSDEIPEVKMPCEWMAASKLDRIVHYPAFLVLIVNLIFLIRIMWVLITKLRSANTIETRQYRKAAKALLVLIPLLGITYLIVIAGPNEGLQGHLFQILQAFLLSIQGFSVALFYCFFNSEVRQALKHRFNRWNDSRNLSSGNSIRSRRYTMSKDYSPRSRTESIRTAEYTVIERMTEL